MSRFNDSITHSAPKKLSFDRLSMSFTEEDSVTGKKKRKPTMRNLFGNYNNISTVLNIV